jgi:hypothetical protein
MKDIPNVSDEVRRLAITAASVARYCDHVEHVEPADADVIAQAGAELRELAIHLARILRCDVIEAYGARLDLAERSYVLGLGEGFEAGRQIALASSWRDLQLIQGHHDRLYRPDVWGLSRLDQLRHCSIHLSKLVGVLADPSSTADDLRIRTAPDILLFGIKLATVAGQALTEDALPGRAGISEIRSKLRT